jgi:hypothetical protein
MSTGQHKQERLAHVGLPKNEEVPVYTRQEYSALVISEHRWWSRYKIFVVFAIAAKQTHDIAHGFNFKACPQNTITNGMSVSTLLLKAAAEAVATTEVLSIC